MANLADVSAQISADDQQLASKVAEMKLQGGGSISSTDMLEMQAIMEHMNEMSKLSSSIVSQTNEALAGMGRKVKE
jgi:hypothetical protein